jgi:tetratricopeptide (TPR) repeat protein
LGIAYQFGYGVEKDLKRAEELFDKGTKYAIDRDNCYCKLGNFCYERGEYEKASEYYGKASALNNARALLNTAIGYFNRDLKMDKSMVACLLSKSAALGNQRAKELFYGLKKDGKL